MIPALTVLQVFIVLLLILVVLMQQNNSDSIANLASSNELKKGGTKNILTKITSILGMALMINSILLAKMVHIKNTEGKSIIQNLEKESSKEQKVENSGTSKGKEDIEENTEVQK